MLNETDAVKTGTITSATSPVSVKVLALTNIAFGILFAGLNVYAAEYLFVSLDRESSDKMLLSFVVAVSIYLCVGVLFILAGSGLAFNRAWGRTLSFLAALCCFLALLVGWFLQRTGDEMVKNRELRFRLGTTFESPMSLPLFWLLYALVVIVLLALPNIGRWAQARRGLTPRSRLSGVAIATLICALIPLPGVAQAAVFLLALVALLQIKRSKGALRGENLVIAGLAISSLMFTPVAAFVMTEIFYENPRYVW